MLPIIFKIEDFSKFDLDKYSDYCKKRKICDNLEIEGNERVKTIKSDNTRLDLKIFNDSPEKYDFLEMKIEDIIHNCNYEIQCDINSEDQLLLMLNLARFISEKTNIVLYNDYDICITGESLKNMGDEEFDLILEEFKIDFKYFDRLKALKDKLDVSTNKLFNNFKGLSLALLIGSSVVAAFLLIYMILILKISNPFILLLPFVIVLGVNIYGPIKNILVSENTRKEYIQTKHEKNIEVCNVYKIRVPKKPSLRDRAKSTKQTFINIFGYLIVPAIIVGSILMTYNVILGVLIIILPWVGLVFIKLFISDVEVDDLIGTLNVLTENLWNVDKGYVGVKYQISEEDNYRWKIEMGGYSLLNMKTINDLESDNVFDLFGGSSLTTKYIGTWEEVERLVGEYINQRVVPSKEFRDREYLRVLTVGFVDGREKIVFIKDEDELLGEENKEEEEI